jgi:hypothetical protein
MQQRTFYKLVKVFQRGQERKKITKASWVSGELVLPSSSSWLSERVSAVTLAGTNSEKDLNRGYYYVFPTYAGYGTILLNIITEG